MVKNWYNFVSFFSEARSITESITIETVDVVAKFIGKYITTKIKKSNKNGGTFSSNFSVDLLFFNAKNDRQPADISQNLDGIKKYAAGWFVGYR